MTSRTLRRLSALAPVAVCAATMAATPALATNGYFANGYGGASKGIAGAGVAFPTGVLGMAQNPATGVMVGNQWGVCMTAFMPSRSYTVSPGFGLIPGSDTSRNEFFLIPCGGANFKLSEDSTLGVFAFGNGGMNSEYAFNPFGGSSPLGVNLEQLFLQVNYAKRVDNTFSFGIGPVLAIQRFSATGLEAFDNPLQTSAPGFVTGNGDDWSHGFGVNLGVLYQPNAQLTFGAAYRTKIDMKPFDKYRGLFAEDGDFDIPAMATVGVAYKPASNPKLTLTAEYQRIFYSDVAAISNSITTATGPLGAAGGPGFGWSDMDVFRIGASYDVDERLTVRGGISHNSEFIDGKDVAFNILAPATPTWHASVGASYKISDRATLTGSYTYAFGDAVEGNGFGNPVSLKMTQHEVSMGVSWKF